MLIDRVSLKQLNMIGAIVGTSVLVTPLMGLEQPLHFAIYGFIYSLYTSLYLWKIQQTKHPVPGLQRLLGRPVALLILYAAFVILLYYWIKAIIAIQG